MVATSVLRGVTAYLSSLDAKSAVYNDDLTLIWSSCDDFFNSLDTRVISDVIPIKSEENIPVIVHKVKYVMNIVPLYRSKTLVCGYVCVLRDSYEMYRMLNSSAVSDYIRSFLKEAQEKTTRIIGVSKVMDGLIPEDGDKEELKQLVHEQNMQATRLFTEASSIDTIISAGTGENAPDVNCNVSALVAVLCVEANQCLVKTKRKLIRDVDVKSYYAKVDYKLFAVAFMSVLRSHMYISPLKSDIEVTSYFDDGSYFYVTVRSQLLPGEELTYTQEQKAIQDRELARMIAAFDCNGSLTFTTDKNTATSEIKIRAFKKNRGPSLTNSNSEYLMGGYKPVHPFIDEITEKEELALTTVKEGKDTASKKSVQKRKKR